MVHDSPLQNECTVSIREGQEKKSNSLASFSSVLLLVKHNLIKPGFFTINFITDFLAQNTHYIASEKEMAKFFSG
jgi:translation elongation factor EF-Ts